MLVTTRATTGVRPGLASSERRVREELADAASGTDRRVFSRELSFVPSQAVPKFDAHDVQTRALIAEQKRLEALRHGAEIAKRLDEWKWVDTMYDAAQKQAHLEPLIFSVQREPVAHEDILLFLLIVLEPIRRGVSASFVHAHGRISRPQAVDWRERIQARMIREIERETLYDVTREADGSDLPLPRRGRTSPVSVGSAVSLRAMRCSSCARTSRTTRRRSAAPKPRRCSSR